MTTLVVELPDNKSEFVYNLLKEFPYTNIYKKENSQSEKDRLADLLKEGYSATSIEDSNISDEFLASDLENWD